jgi:AraC family transcriptional regulator, regulatory protein of adaptative response / DNA-3-methyladenine glycosylase II
LGDDAIIGTAMCAEPGRRCPGHVDGFELAVRAVLGQQVSVAGARTLAARLVAAHGGPLTTASGELTHLFPTAEQVAAADPTTLSLTQARASSLIGLARAVADGDIDLDPGADRDRTAAQLLALPGIGPWTVSYIRMRALADPDVFMASDLGVRRGLQELGFTGGLSDIEKLAQRWRPWRSYALAHIWAAASRRPATTTATSRRPAQQLREEKSA